MESKKLKPGDLCRIVNHETYSGKTVRIRDCKPIISQQKSLQTERVIKVVEASK